jgi:hypothetical protein
MFRALEDEWSSPFQPTSPPTDSYSASGAVAGLGRAMLTHPEVLADHPLQPRFVT